MNIWAYYDTDGYSENLATYKGHFNTTNYIYCTEYCFNKHKKWSKRKRIIIMKAVHRALTKVYTTCKYKHNPIYWEMEIT